MRQRMLFAPALFAVAAWSLTGCDARQKATDAPASAGKPGVAYASIDVKCSGGKTYTLDTGTTKGFCSATYSGTKVTEASCSDGTNYSNLKCSMDSPCTSSNGSGSCKVK